MRWLALAALACLVASSSMAQPPRPPQMIGPASRVTCDNSTMSLTGSPDTVQECLEALDTQSVTSPWAPSQGAMVNGSFVGANWMTCDLDDCPGVADGAGADPNPYTAAMDSVIRTGVYSAPFTNSVDPIHLFTSFNHATSSSRFNQTLYASQMFFEYGYDGAQRSGSETVEWNWDIAPSSHLISINSDIDAASGSFTPGDNVTFSNGAVCRTTSSPTALPTSNARLTCNNGTPPADNNTITACTSGCDGTVNGTPVSERNTQRLLASHWISSANYLSFLLMKGTNALTGVSEWWISAQPGASSMYLGWDGQASASAQSINLPATTSNPFLSGAGAVAVDITNAATFAGQLKFHDGSASRALSATQTACFEQIDLDAADVDRVMPFASRTPVTLTAMGCRNQTSSAPSTAATLTLETIAGAAITLASTLTCVGNATTISWVTTVDSDAVLVSGGGVRFDVSNTPSPATDEHTICVSYLETLQ